MTRSSSVPAGWPAIRPASGRRAAPWRGLLMGLSLGAMLLPRAALALPVVSLASEVVQVHEIEGSDVVLVGVNRVVTDLRSVVRPISELLEDTDTDGTVSFTPGDGVSEQSLWIAVDSSGVPVAGFPDEVEVGLIEVDLAQALLEGPSGSLDHLAVETSSLLTWCVRPGVGAWMARVNDGGPTDADLENDGSVTVDLGAAEPLEDDGGEFDYVKPGDVLVGVNSRNLTFFAIAVTE